MSLADCELENEWNDFQENLLLKLSLTCPENNLLVKISVDEKTCFVQAKTSNQVKILKRKVKSIIGNGKSLYGCLYYDGKNKPLRPDTKLSETNLSSIHKLYLVYSKKELFSIFIKSLEKLKLY